MVIPARQKRKRSIDCRRHPASIKHNSIRESIKWLINNVNLNFCLAKNTAVVNLNHTDTLPMVTISMEYNKLKNYVFLSLASFVLIFLAGCKTTEITKDFSFSKTAPNGLVVVSITHAEPVILNGVSLHYAHEEKGHFESLKGLRGEFRSKNVLGMYEDVLSDFSNVRGDLVVVELPPGRYLRRQLQASRPQLGYNTISELWPIPESEREFFVRAGEVTYLGEYKVSAYASNPAGYNAKFSNVVHTYPKARDFAVLKAKYPHVKF